MKHTCILFILILINNINIAQPLFVKNEIIVKIDGKVGVDCDFSGNRGIQNAIESIKDASENKHPCFA